MDNAPVSGTSSLTPTAAERLDQLCDRFEAAWKAGQRPRIEDYVGGSDESERAVGFRLLLELEWDYRCCDGEHPCLDEYLKRFSAHEAIVREAVAAIAVTASGKAAPHPAHPIGPAFAVGQRLGEYELLGRLGAGGMGVVYQARHAFLNRLVALKILPTERMTNRRAVERFRHEMAVVGQLSHPNVVAAHDAREEAGTYFLGMEYVPGVDLHTLVRRIGPLPVPEACELACQAALGLQYIHEHHLVHRDIKPSNMVVTPDGVVKVLDLGLALLAEDRPAAEQMTSAGQMLGTTDYVAPEQVSDAHQVDHRADLYSLGCTLYRMLAGRAPFGDPQHQDPLQKLLAHLDEAPPPLQQFRPEIPSALAALVHRLLAKQPAERFASAAEVAAALQPFTAGSDLAGLFARGGQFSPAQRDADRPLSSTADRLSSPHVETGTALPLVTRRRNRVWSSRRLRLAAGGVVLAVLLGGVCGVFRMATDYGTLEFRTSDRDVRVEVQQGGEQVDVVHLDTRLSIRLRCGEYQLKLAEGSRAELDRGTIRLFRGAREIVAIRGLSDRARLPDPGSSPATMPRSDSIDAPSEYLLVELKYPDDKVPNGAMGLNNRGDVVGYFGSKEVGYQKGFLFSRGEFRRIDVGDGQCIPRAINDAGQIVFRAPKAILLADGRVTEIGQGSAEGINQSGDVVGILGSEAFVYRAGKIQKLSQPPNTHLAHAAAIGDSGHIVGWYRYESNGPNHAFVFVDGVMKRLDDQEGLMACTADDVNASGQVVGTCQTVKDGPARVFLYENGVARVLPPFGRWSVPRAINSSGEVVGDWSPHAGGRFIFLAKPSRLLSIPIPSWTDCLPLDINELGQITGYGCRADGKRSAFLLTPKHLRKQLEEQHGPEIVRNVVVVTAEEVKAETAATATIPSDPSAQADSVLPPAKLSPDTKSESAPHVPASGPLDSPAHQIQSAKPSPPPLALAPFSATEACRFQERWAQYLGITVETTNTLGMRFVLIPPGEFDMGSSRSEIDQLIREGKAAGHLDSNIDRFRGETPRHHVRLAHPFYLGVCEVTQEQYERIMGANPSHCTFYGGEAPVEQVSCYEACEFCQKLSAVPGEQANGHKYRLPTEAEWEYACRAGTTTRFWFGESVNAFQDCEWWIGNAGDSTRPVGRKKGNPFGLFDMHGNVTEFCADWYDPDYYGTSPTDDPQGPVKGISFRSQRGGCFRYDGSLSRSAVRRGSDGPHASYGFRVVLNVVPTGPVARPPTGPKPSAAAIATKSPASQPQRGSPQAPPAAVAPFNADQARRYQEDWARYLGVAVETTNSLGMQFVLIPPGEYERGARDGEEGHANERPRHRVRISRPFLVGQHEITQGQYERGMEHNPSFFSANNAERYKERLASLVGMDTSRFPVECVSWFDCIAFANALSEREGKQHTIE